MTKQDLINILNTYPDNTSVVVGLPVVGEEELEIFPLEIEYFGPLFQAAIISPGEDRIPVIEYGMHEEKLKCYKV